MDLDKIELLKSVGIDVSKNMYLMGKEYSELEYKINFLLEKNIPVQTDGKPHEIFWINYKKLETKYGITKEDMFKSKSKAK